MATTTPTTPDRDLAARLRAAKLRVTSQRLIIHRVMRDLDRHVTAEEVAKRAARRLPGLSLPTVYSTLELLEGLGLLRRVPLSTGAVLWDPRLTEHHHAACRDCGRLTDLEASIDTAAGLRAARAEGFDPERAEMVVVGRCADCARSGKTT